MKRDRWHHEEDARSINIGNIRARMNTLSRVHGMLSPRSLGSYPRERSTMIILGFAFLRDSSWYSTSRYSSLYVMTYDAQVCTALVVIHHSELFLRGRLFFLRWPHRSHRLFMYDMIQNPRAISGLGADFENLMKVPGQPGVTHFCNGVIPVEKYQE